MRVSWGCVETGVNKSVLYWDNLYIFREQFLDPINQRTIMAETGGVLTITIIGACAFLILVALNMIFFLNQDKGVLDWLKHATSKQRIIAIIDGIVTFFCALDFLHILLIFLI
tara:strand:+ start:1375 stop:1713 length:339 start_codon:yes stop_codon:yes gene_type:complete